MPKPISKPKPKPKPRTKPKPNQGDMSPLSGLLGALLGGNSEVQSQSGNSGQSMDDVIGALTGQGSTSQAGSGGLPGGSGAGANPLGDIIGGLLGGGGGGTGGSALGSNAFLAPIVDAIAKKIGVDPRIAQIVVGFALSKLLAAQSGSRDPNLRGLVDRMGSGKRIDQEYLNSTGLVSELASQSGLDNETAAQGLIQVLNTFSKQMG